MRTPTRLFFVLALLSLSFLPAGCGGGGGGEETPEVDYTVTLVAGIPGAGTVTGGGMYTAGSTATIIATPNPGFLLSQFTIDAVAVTANPLQRNFNRDVTVNAVFRAGPRAWTWVSGPAYENHAGVYGTPEVANPANQPGARGKAAVWCDDGGNFWVNGGYGRPAPAGSTYYGDMWKYDASLGQWAWMAGPLPSSSKIAPLFTTLGVPDEAAYPGWREWATSITSGSDLWLFGGRGMAVGGSGHLNDLWRFHRGSGEWEWVSGSKLANQMGVYGEVGAPASTNAPGGRFLAAGMADPSGKLWIFGGDGWDEVTQPHWLNDLWRYDPASGKWTWMSGQKAWALVGVYGTRGVADAANFPGARWGACGTATPDGLLWVFGGYGYDGSTAFPRYLADLWSFDPGTGMWTWVAGPDKGEQKPAVYGARGVPAASNLPSSRCQAALWADAYGALWLYGGEGYDPSGGNGPLSDLWRFDPATGYWAWMGGSQFLAIGYNYGPQGVAGTSYTPGYRYYMPMAPLPGTAEMWVFGGYLGGWFYLSDLWLGTVAP